MSTVKSVDIIPELGSDLVLSRVMLGVVGTPREIAAAAADATLADPAARCVGALGQRPFGSFTRDAQAVVEAYEAVSRGRTAQAARRLLELEGKRIRFRDSRVRAEIAASANGELIQHPGDRRGLLLHPVMLEALNALADVRCYELGWLRATHGKYKTTAGDTSVTDRDAEVSAHFFGMGADFYAVGPSLDRLVTHEAGQSALDDVLRPLVRAIWDGVATLPGHWWVVMPPSLNAETPGTRAGVEYFSNDRHRDHLHIGLNN